MGRLIMIAAVCAGLTLTAAGRADEAKETKSVNAAQQLYYHQAKSDFDVFWGRNSRSHCFWRTNL